MRFSLLLVLLGLIACTSSSAVQETFDDGPSGSCEIQYPDGRHICSDYFVGFSAGAIELACSGKGTFRTEACATGGAIGRCDSSVPDSENPVETTVWVYADPEGRERANCGGAYSNWIEGSFVAGTCSCTHDDSRSSAGKSCQYWREQGTCPTRYHGTGATRAACNNDARQQAPSECRGCLKHCDFINR